MPCTAITLEQLTKELNSWPTRKSPYPIPLDWVLSILFPHHEHCSLNHHLATPLHDRSKRPTSRLEPLPPDLLVFGDWLLFTFLDHDGYSLLSEHQSREELEEAILCPSGIMNGYVGCQIALEYGRVLPYSITFRDLNGERKEFSIELRDTPRDDLTWENLWDSQFPDPILTWLER
jgi:hypothetical protein